jgi:hypothetical protein
MLVNQLKEKFGCKILLLRLFFLVVLTLYRSDGAGQWKSCGTNIRAGSTCDAVFCPEFLSFLKVAFVDGFVE